MEEEQVEEELVVEELPAAMVLRKEAGGREGPSQRLEGTELLAGRTVVTEHLVKDKGRGWDTELLGRRWGRDMGLLGGGEGRAGAGGRAGEGKVDRAGLVDKACIS